MRKIGAGIWIHERPFRLFGADFGNRMTIIEVSDGALLVHSPTALDDTLKSDVERLGRVAYLITPNAFHGMFTDDWMTALPDARHFTARTDNTGKNKSEPLSLCAMTELSPALETARVEGIPKLQEYVFYHRPSRTLILTDLAFNIGTDVPMWTKIFFSLNDAYGKFGPSRLMRSMITDKTAFKASLAALLEWDFEQIIVSHGDIVEQDGKNVLRRAFQPYLVTPPNRLVASSRFPIRCG